MRLLKALEDKGVLFLDGAMGTEIEKRKAKPGKHINLEQPQIIEEIQRRYVNAGSDCIITNSMTYNRVYDKTHGGDGDIAAANIKSVEIARRAVGEKGFVLGDMTTTGQFLEPLGDLKEEEAFEAFFEQANNLAKAGVDGFIIETMIDLSETVLAVKACRQAAHDLPVIASMTYSTLNNGGRTIMGNSAAQCAQELVEAGADIIGANCGDLKPEDMTSIISIYKENASVPILVQPNAGLPELVDGKPVFNLSPQEFAEDMMSCYRAGASLLGGCCGTTPEHIKMLREVWENER